MDEHQVKLIELKVRSSAEFPVFITYCRTYNMRSKHAVAEGYYILYQGETSYVREIPVFPENKQNDRSRLQVVLLLSVFVQITFGLFAADFVAPLYPDHSKLP